MIIQDPTVMRVKDTVRRTKIQNCLEIANPEPSEVWKVKRFMPRKDYRGAVSIDGPAMVSYGDLRLRNWLGGKSR
jgi:hypothetical protein